MPFLFFLALQAAPLVHYDDLPNPTPARVRGCAAEYDRLQQFTARFKQITFNRELPRGGRLQWTEANDIRNAADAVVRPYMEAIREIAYTGDKRRCMALANEGIGALTDDVIRPVFGRR